MENIKSLSETTVKTTPPDDKYANSKSFQDFINVLSQIVEKHGGSAAFECHYGGKQRVREYVLKQLQHEEFMSVRIHFYPRIFVTRCSRVLLLYMGRSESTFCLSREMGLSK